MQLLRVALLLSALVAWKVDAAGDLPRRLCYFGSWALYRTGEIDPYSIDDIPADLCTHLIYGFATISPDTYEIIPSDYDLDITRGGFSNFTGIKKKHPYVRTLLSVGGWGKGKVFSDMASDPKNRRAFITSAVKYFEVYGFDGIDVDWEFPGDNSTGGTPADMDNFYLLVREIRQEFNMINQILDFTVVVSVKESIVDNAYYVSDICKLVDSVSLLTYDMRGFWDGFTDVSAPLHTRPDLDLGDYKTLNVEDGAKLWEDLGCPKDKIVVGIPFYGNTYELEDPNVNGLHAPIRGPGLIPSSSLDYYLICPNENDADWNTRFDEVGVAPYTSMDSLFIGYDDVRSVQKKAEFIKDKGYIGAMVFAVDKDDHANKCGQGKNPLMTAIYNVLKTQ